MPELITQTRDGFFWAALVEGKTLIDLAVDRAGETCLYQSIWRVKVDRMVPNVGAFVSMGDRSGLFRDFARQSGDHVVAQVKSLRSEGKADVITDDVTLGGTYFIYLPRDEKIRTSRKIDPLAAYPIITALEDAGISSGIVRAVALTAPLETVIAEALALRDKWLALTQSGPTGLLQNGPNAADRLRQDYSQHTLTPVEEPFEARGIAEQIAALRQPQIKLPSGGSIVIERTAALTAIDVNAGTVAPVTADREALELIVRHIRLRNLSGLIVIDFSSSAAKDKPEALLEQVRRAIADDPATSRVAGASPSGLVEVIRPARDLPLAEKLARFGA